MSTYDQIMSNKQQPTDSTLFREPISGGMTKVAANIDNAFSSPSRRISSASAFDFANRNSQGPGGVAPWAETQRIQIRTNSEVQMMSLIQGLNIDFVKGIRLYEYTGTWQRVPGRFRYPVPVSGTAMVGIDIWQDNTGTWVFQPSKRQGKILYGI